MWRVTLIMNALLMGLFGCGGLLSLARLRNLGVENFNILGPGWSILAHWAMRAESWCLCIPGIWLVYTVIAIIVANRRIEPPLDFVGLHTSATLLIGLTMLGFFLFAGVMPFLSIGAMPH